MRVQDVQTQDDNGDALVRVWGSSAIILLVSVLLLGWRALRALSSLLNFSECRCGVPTASVSVRQCNDTDL